MVALTDVPWPAVFMFLVLLLLGLWAVWRDS